MNPSLYDVPGLVKFIPYKQLQHQLETKSQKDATHFFTDQLFNNCVQL